MRLFLIFIKKEMHQKRDASAQNSDDSISEECVGDVS